MEVVSDLCKSMSDPCRSSCQSIYIRRRYDDVDPHSCINRRSALSPIIALL